MPAEPDDVLVDARGRVGRYVMLARLGAGGMGVVYAAYDPDLDRRVAIKLMRAPHHGDARLLREAKAMARLQHPNVITIYDVGVHEGQVFVAMDIIDGTTLRGWLAEPRPWREVLAAFTKAGQGLAAAHHAGIVHRDFKLDNVLVARDGRVLVTDFGLARVDVADEPSAEREVSLPPVTPATALTVTGSLLGTPAYMAPEQHRGARVDARSDQFSFCVALYEALCREHPFAAPWTVETAMRAMEADRLRVPRTRRMPARVLRALRRGLRYDPAERWPSMDALLAVVRPRRALLWALSAAAIALVAGAFVLASAFGSSEAPVSCKESTRALDAVWSPARRAWLATRFAATAELPTGPAVAQRVSKVVDSYSRSWASMRVDACEATRIRGTQSAELLDRRMRCLDLRLAALDGVVNKLTTAKPTDTVNRAVQAALALPPVSDCADVDALLAIAPPPSNPAARRRYEALSERLAREHATAEVDGVTITTPEIDALVADARALGQPSVLAAALRLRAMRQNGDGEYDAAVAAAREAALAAARAGDDQQAVTARTNGAYAFTNTTRIAEGLAMLDTAELAAARAGNPPLLVGLVEESRGNLHQRLSRLADADAAYRRALPALEQALGADHYLVARAVSNWANVVAAIGDHPRAEQMYQRVLRIHRATLGPDHPFVAATQNNLADMLVEAGRLVEARDLATAALAEKRRILRPGHPSIATTLQVLGVAERQLGELDAAEHHIRESFEIRRAAFGDDNVVVLASRRHLAVVAVMRGDVDAGIAELERLVAKLRDEPENRAYLGNALESLGDVLAIKGDLAGATRALTETRDLYAQLTSAESWPVAGMRAKLATVLVRRGNCAGALREAEQPLALGRRTRSVTDPGWVLALAATGECFHRAGNSAAARVTLEELAALPTPAGPERVTAARGYALLARMLAADGDRARAAELEARAASAAEPPRR